MARLSFRCSDELVAAVDAKRGLIPRETWLRAAIEQMAQSTGPGSVVNVPPGRIVVGDEPLEGKR